VPIQVRKARNLDKNKKETSECEVRAAADSGRVYRWIGSFMYTWRGVLGNDAIQVAHLWEMGSRVSFPSSSGAPRLPLRWLHWPHQ